jgi:hypothetical protein
LKNTATKRKRIFDENIHEPAWAGLPILDFPARFALKYIYVTMMELRDLLRY